MPKRAISLLLAVWLLAGCGSLPAGPPDGAAREKAAQPAPAGATDPSAGDPGAQPDGIVTAQPPPALAAAGQEPAAGAPAQSKQSGPPAAGSGEPGAFVPTLPGHGGYTLPRCAAWIWEGKVGSDGARQLDVAVLAFPNQPLFPALACWGPEGVTPPTPVLEVLQADGMQVHGVAHEHYNQKVNRHLWIFSITAPPYRGSYYIRFQADGAEWITIPFEVTDP